MFAPRTGPPLGALALALLLLSAVAVLRRPTGGEEALSIGLLGLGGGLLLFLAVFFRDPERSPGEGIVSPADGRVSLIRSEGDRIRIAVFMNVSDVHVNRFPLDARVEAVADAGAGHVPAYRSAAQGNVQRAYRLSTRLGEVELVQVTGVLARRLVSFVRAGESYRKGDRLGMIVLGSRVDLLLPAGKVVPSVAVGDRVHAGLTPLARER